MLDDPLVQDFVSYITSAYKAQRFLGYSVYTTALQGVHTKLKALTLVQQSQAYQALFYSLNMHIQATKHRFAVVECIGATTLMILEEGIPRLFWELHKVFLTQQFSDERSSDEHVQETLVRLNDITLALIVAQAQELSKLSEKQRHVLRTIRAEYSNRSLELLSFDRHTS